MTTDVRTLGPAPIYALVSQTFAQGETSISVHINWAGVP